VRHNERLSRHSQFGVGGLADLFLGVDDPALVAELIGRCTESGVAVTVLGAAFSVEFAGGVELAYWACA